MTSGRQTLAEAALQAIAADGPAWLPGLARSLSAAEWSDLAALKLGRGTYSTTAFLGHSGQERFAQTPIADDGSDGGRPRLEWPSAPLRSTYAEHGLDFLESEAEPRVAAALRRALETTSRIPSLWEAVTSVVASVHPLRPCDEEVDVSYSDPRVPFSIFVGVHDVHTAEHDLRLVEGVVHEAMHLQLSMLERTLPMIGTPEAVGYSPWKAERRPLQGVLHGAYVFRCISDFYGCLTAMSPASLLTSFCASRRGLIHEEIDAALGHNLSHPGFTPAGRLLAKRLVRTTI